jgi:hypothetical protein
MQTLVHSGIDPQALTLEEVARLLSAAGGKKITAAQIQADLEAGAPQRPDGRVNLVHYAAWLAQQLQGEGGGH